MGGNCLTKEATVEELLYIVIAVVLGVVLIVDIAASALSSRISRKEEERGE